MIETIEVLEALFDVEDPELGVNIVDLGLIRGIDIEGNVVKLTLTLTSAACPLVEEMEEKVQESLVNVASRVDLEWEWEPQWKMEDLTPSGREQLVALGMSIPAY